MGDATPTFWSGDRHQTTYDTRRYYVLAMFKDKSRAMLASFPRKASEQPCLGVADYLAGEFIAGQSADARAEGVILFLIMKDPLGDKESTAIARAYFEMCQMIVMFKVLNNHILDPARFACNDGDLLLVGMLPKFPLLIGNKGYQLE